VTNLKLSFKQTSSKNLSETMSNDIELELEDFSSKRHSDEVDSKSVDENTASVDGTIGLWVWTSAAL